MSLSLLSMYWADDERSPVVLFLLDNLFLKITHFPTRVQMLAFVNTDVFFVSQTYFPFSVKVSIFTRKTEILFIVFIQEVQSRYFKKNCTMLSECIYTNGKQVLNGQRNMLRAKLLYKSVNLPCRQIQSMKYESLWVEKLRWTLERKKFLFPHYAAVALFSFYVFLFQDREHFVNGRFISSLDLWRCRKKCNYFYATIGFWLCLLDIM